jgi:hypothetical protein
MQPPPSKQQPRILYEMGELAGAELQQVLSWWRDDYEAACEMDDRTEHWQWRNLPPKLVQQWDRARRRALQKAGLVPLA